MEGCAPLLSRALSRCCTCSCSCCRSVTAMSMKSMACSNYMPCFHQHCRLLDRWVILGSARDIAEMFVPAMGALGR